MANEQWNQDIARVVELIDEVAAATGHTSESDLLDPVANAIRSEAELWQRVNRRGPYAACVAAFVQREKRIDQHVEDVMRSIDDRDRQYEADDARQRRDAEADDGQFDQPPEISGDRPT